MVQIMVMARRREDLARYVRMAELINAFRFAAYRYEESCIRCADKMRRIVRERSATTFAILGIRCFTQLMGRLGEPSLPDHFFIRSNTALVIPTIPTRIVGSGTGANLLE